jgi:hypothetical protein
VAQLGSTSPVFCRSRPSSGPAPTQPRLTSLRSLTSRPRPSSPSLRRRTEPEAARVQVAPRAHAAPRLEPACLGTPPLPIKAIASLHTVFPLGTLARALRRRRRTLAWLPPSVSRSAASPPTRSTPRALQGSKEPANVVRVLVLFTALRARRSSRRRSVPLTRAARCLRRVPAVLAILGEFAVTSTSPW